MSFLVIDVFVNVNEYVVKNILGLDFLAWSCWLACHYLRERQLDILMACSRSYIHLMEVAMIASFLAAAASFQATASSFLAAASYQTIASSFLATRASGVGDRTEERLGYNWVQAAARPWPAS